MKSGFVIGHFSKLQSSFLQLYLQMQNKRFIRLRMKAKQIQGEKTAEAAMSERTIQRLENELI